MSAEDPVLNSTDTSRYHGGHIPEELAALLSLVIGGRVLAGGVTRRFEKGENVDPLGTPLADREVPIPPPSLFGRTRLIPSTCGTRELNKSARTFWESYPLLTPDKATALVRSARLYQSALWVAESQPELCWLFLVSAVECAAVARQILDTTPVSILELCQPRVVKSLRASGGEILVEEVATAFHPLLRSTARFIEFILQFLPPAPQQRPPETLRIPWEPSGMKRALNKIYGFRSSALHDGTPFPKPMCEPPGIPSEIPPFLAVATNDGVWTKDDLPMLLHTFEYVVRGSLLRWWKEEADLARPADD